MAEGGGEFDADIISEILARLPVKSLMRFRCVCKSWSCLISDPYLAKRHLSYAERGITEISSRLIYSMDPPRSLDHEALKDLKDHVDGHFANRELGFPGSTLSYGILVLDTPRCPRTQFRYHQRSFCGLVLGEPNAGYGELRSRVLSFDLVEEKFHEMIPLPDDDVYFHGISVLRNCLCVYKCLAGRAGVSSIWLMQEYGVKQSWTQVMKFSPKGLPQEFKHLLLHPICILENGLVLFNAGLLMLYDPKENTFESVFKTHDKLNCGAFIYRETLVSPVTSSAVDI